jgi:CBS domain-containing membrane protein
MPSLMPGRVVRDFRMRAAGAGRRSVFGLGLWVLAGGFASIAILGAIAIVSGLPFIFPSLGPTAFLIFNRQRAPDAWPRNAILGHLIGASCGYLALVLFGLTEAGPAYANGVSVARDCAAAFSLALTCGLMIWLRAPHPPAGATTLIVSLGVMSRPDELVVLMAAVGLLVALGYIFNRLAGFHYPLWADPLTPVPPDSRAD